MTPEEENALLKEQLALLQQQETHQPEAAAQTSPTFLAKREALLSHMKETFQSAYLTLDSIIQGVALGYLVTILVSNQHSFALFAWINAYTSFMVIMLVWAEMLLNTFAFTYITDVFDILVPFLYFALQIPLFRFIEQEPLYLLFSVFTTTFGGLFYLHAVSQAHKYRTENDYTLCVLKKHHLIVLSVVGFVVYDLLFLLFFFLSETFPGSQTLTLLFSVCEAVLSSLFLLRFSLVMKALVSEGHPPRG